MKNQRLAIALTIANLALFAAALLQSHSANAQGGAHMLRAGGLEIIDSHGRVRASITVEPPVTIGSRTYPETVLLRLTDPKNGPVVKLTASAEGSALGLSDDAEGGVELSAIGRKGNYVKVASKSGRTQIMKP